LAFSTGFSAGLRLLYNLRPAKTATPVKAMVRVKVPMIKSFLADIFYFLFLLFYF